MTVFSACCIRAISAVPSFSAAAKDLRTQFFIAGGNSEGDGWPWLSADAPTAVYAGAADWDAGICGRTCVGSPLGWPMEMPIRRAAASAAARTACAGSDADADAGDAEDEAGACGKRESRNVARERKEYGQWRVCVRTARLTDLAHAHWPPLEDGFGLDTVASCHCVWPCRETTPLGRGAKEVGAGPAGAGGGPGGGAGAGVPGVLGWERGPGAPGGGRPKSACPGGYPG